MTRCETCGERDVDRFDHYHQPQPDDVPMIDDSGHPADVEVTGATS